MIAFSTAGRTVSSKPMIPGTTGPPARVVEEVGPELLLDRPAAQPEARSSAEGPVGGGVEGGGSRAASVRPGPVDRQTRRRLGSLAGVGGERPHHPEELGVAGDLVQPAELPDLGPVIFQAEPAVLQA